MRTLIYGYFNFFDENNKLKKIDDVDMWNGFNKGYFACPLCEKVIDIDDENINEDYNDSNSNISHDEHGFLLCYGRENYNYCVEKISMDDAKNFLKNMNIKNEFEMTDDFNYYFIQIIKITHLIKSSDKKIVDKCIHDEEEIDNELFSEVDIYDYCQYCDCDKYLVCCDPKFFYKGICEHCNTTYNSFAN